MIIEQTFNRFFGTDLNNGRGVASVVVRYLLTMPSASGVMECFESYCNFRSTLSEQQVDLNCNRKKTGGGGSQKLVFWLIQHKPFDFASSLMSLSTGLIGDVTINCHIALVKGLEAMDLIDDKDLANISF